MTIEQPHPDDRIVIIGGGQAGAECAASLRMAGHRGPVTILTAEPAYPYARPPLSKAYLSGAATVEDLYIRPPATYAQQDLDIRLGTRVTAIDRVRRYVRVAAGPDVPYDRLVLATGGRARPLPVPGAVSAPNVHTLRGLADVDAMREQFTPGARLVVVGGGYVGLEVAAVGSKAGLKVTVLEAAPRVLARVTAAVVSEFYERVHAEQGVEVRTGCSVGGLEYGLDGRALGVTLADGTRLPADLVVVGIGLVPNTELAEAAGLPVDDGILVDEFCRTADPHILAIGDCTRHPCAQHGGFRRLESVPNATEQARVASAVLTGAPRAYDAIPWFWSDQYDVKLQTVGLSAGHDEVVVRGRTDTGRSFTVFYLEDGEVTAADVVNGPRDFMVAKKLVASRARVSSDLLRDQATPLKQCL
ncbi:3-phenylpropionate/trans-cinnamate dioxygenase ferredoxin reductase subunit [Nocardia amikacinitolerans]|uniref:NAD(P)/FAD-dependent oxidoreductase n=1 Tax=Nocardia amikacinitolerans TaxID=756689 RepID=UPI000835E613|nr:FAD-dependent oxidoreductase [Nocardia amikacinitolerans]MCP2317697.1 3-phenylpropionate/trans-cinnamate dioxygenase ferredoxin reductase subunit [Nocardia amikacinitolerans]